ncbi:MAG: Kelch repeat-containing protein, partial [Planctomycetota bacterium]
PSWQALTATGTGPSARNGLFAVLDPGGGRILTGFGNDGTASLSDTYGLALASLNWSPTGQPTTTGRDGGSAVLEGSSERLLVFGGQDSGASHDDLFTFELATSIWSTRQVTGSAPSGRAYASLIFDPVDDRAVLFGGGDASSVTVYDHLYQLR